MPRDVQSSQSEPQSAMLLAYICDGCGGQYNSESGEVCACLDREGARHLAEIECVPATWDGLLAILARHYPPEVFVGESDDPGLQIVALARALNNLHTENARLRDALDTIASGHAFGPVEVARVALGLKSSCDCRYCAEGLPSRCCIAPRKLSPAESDRVIEIISRALGEER